MPLQEAEVALSEVEAVWEAKLNEAVKAAVIPLEVEIAELKVRAEKWATEARNQAAIAREQTELADRRLGGVFAFGISFVVALVMAGIGLAT